MQYLNVYKVVHIGNSDFAGKVRLLVGLLAL
jgi:hypothetical protein